VSASVIQISDVLGQPAGSLRTPEPTSGYALLFDICRELQALEDDLDGVLALIVEKAVEMLGCDAAWLMLADERTGALRTAVARGLRTAALATLELAPGARPPEQLTRAERIRALAHAPMRLDEQLVGVLYAGMRRGTPFASTHASMLSTLAEHGSIAIHNARLLHELGNRNAVLEQSFAIHRQVTAVGLREGGEQGIVPTLARMLGRRIAVEPDAASRLAGRIDSDPDAPLLEPLAGRAAMRAGETPLGEILAYGPSLSELEQRALEHGATVLAAELLRQRSAREAEWRLQGELLEELVDAPAPLPESLRLRAAHMHVDLARPRHMLDVDTGACHGSEGRLLGTARTVVARHVFGRDAGPALAFQRGERIVLGVPACEGLDVMRIAAQLARELTALGAPASIGVSRPATDLGRASREARACARLAATGFGDGSILAGGDLAPFDALFDAQAADQAEALVREQLGALARHDRDGRVPLLETVRAFVESGGQAARAAERCFVHVTTLKYRLGLAAAHLREPLDTLDTRFELRVAFRTLAVLEALGRDPLGRGELATHPGAAGRA